MRMRQSGIARPPRRGTWERSIASGCLYSLGLGVPQDRAMAFFWVDAAASNTPVEDPKREEIVRDWQSAASRMPFSFLSAAERSRRVN
jgi:hypothetical protein